MSFLELLVVFGAVGGAAFLIFYRWLGPRSQRGCGNCQCLNRPAGVLERQRGSGLRMRQRQS